QQKRGDSIAARRIAHVGRDAGIAPRERKRAAGIASPEVSVMHQPELEAVLQTVLAQRVIHAGLSAVRLAGDDVPLADARLQVILERELRIRVGNLQLTDERFGETERADIDRIVHAELLETL